MARPFSRLFCRRFINPSASPIRASVLRTQRPTNTSHTFKRFVAGGPRPPKNELTVWPFVAIFALGTGAYVLMVQSRIGKSNSPHIPFSNSRAALHAIKTSACTISSNFPSSTALLNLSPKPNQPTLHLIFNPNLNPKNLTTLPTTQNHPPKWNNSPPPKKTPQSSTKTT